MYKFWVCVHCDLDDLNMTFVQGRDTPLGIENSCKSNSPKMSFWLYVYFNIDLWNMTLGKGYDTLFGVGLCEVLVPSKFNKLVKSYIPIAFLALCPFWP